MKQQDTAIALAGPASFYTLETIERGGLPVSAPPVRHYANSYMLLFAAGGTGFIHIEGEAFDFGIGKCFLIHPDSMWSIELAAAYGDGAYYRLDFTIGAGHLGDQVTGGLLPHKNELVCTPFAKAMELVEQLYASRHDSGELRRFSRYVRFQELLLMLFSQNTEDTVANKKKASTEQQGLALSIQYIHEHYQDVLTVEGLSDMAGIERWKYARLFKGATGEGPLHYLNSIRIDQAKKWLLKGEDNLSEIALHTGFSNEYYFNRRFKQLVGISPGQYRRSHREQLRVVAPYLEDFIVALGMLPVAQYSHAKWGKQDYLALEQIPTFDEFSGDFSALSHYAPDFILLLDRYAQSQYTECRQISNTCVLSELSENWRTLLRTVADYFGRVGQAEQVIAEYEKKAKAARQTLRRSRQGETVAFLRISADSIYQYTDRGRGFAAAVLYGDLGLCPSPAVQLGPIPSKTVGSRMIKVTLEELALLSADHLFITFDKWHSQAEGEERRLLEQPEWRSLPAVQNSCVYEVDFLTWMNNGVISNSKKIDDILRALA
ncbi:AraC family transcriptional regulator [Paenibacillus sp. BIHB 4019]|uniref:AraC family transcriptional regulator n=1 Tax=Paenibacillus sp. BIHB 4019 TaxID=1870819 RepID=A0A1B2DDX3_9BACL|nr:AraC family transcriptional regulator [Paenibacillus sp. BIHB 4019]ANY65900.1 AraC family transcriptional regulator [Paenibacillus sp. BIHB 4019]